MQLDTTFVSIATVFLLAAAIIIAAYGQKTSHWQLRKVIFPDFEINKLFQ